MPAGHSRYYPGLQNLRIKIEVKTTAPHLVKKAEILEYDSRIGRNGAVLAETEGESGGRFERTLELEEAKLWDTEHPNLYTCRITFRGVMQEERFGIERFLLTGKKAFCSTEGG